VPWWQAFSPRTSKNLLALGFFFELMDTFHVWYPKLDAILLDGAVPPVPHTRFSWFSPLMLERTDR